MKIINRILYAGLLVLLGVNSQAQGDSSTFLFSAVKSEQDPADKEAIALRLERNAGGGQQAQMLVDFSRMYVAEAYAGAGNVTKAKEWLYKLTDTAYLETTVLSVADELMRAKKYDEAAALLKPYINRPEAGNASQQTGFVTRPGVRQFGLAWGAVLYKKGKYKEALPWLAPAQADTATGSRGHSPSISALDFFKGIHR